MKTYVALLRGINVSGQKKIRMADLKISLENAGLQSVSTYIQSGNLVFESENPQGDELETTIHTAILKDFGFDVPTLVLSGDDIKSILESNPYGQEADEKGLYFVLLKEPPNEENVLELNAMEFENEAFHVTPNCVYLNCKAGYGKAKLNNNLVERKLKVEATTRNLKTMRKLLKMTEAITG